MLATAARGVLPGYDVAVDWQPMVATTNGASDSSPDENREN